MSVHSSRTPIVASILTLLGLVSIFLFYVPALSMDETWAVVYFTEEVEIGEIIDAMSGYDVRLITMLREYDVDGVLRTDGYNLEFDEWRDIEELRGLYWQSHGVMLEDFHSQEAMHRTLDKQEVPFTAIDGCWDNRSCPDVWVVRLEFLGSVDTLAKMADEVPFIDYVEIESRGEALRRSMIEIVTHDQR